MDQPEEHKHHRVDATVVDVDPSVEPIESVVVGDKRSNFGRRLGLLAITMLLLFFAISGYIQSARNGQALNRAAADRSKLIASISQLTDINQKEVKYAQRLQDALAEQNKLLKQAGFQTVQIPPAPVIPSSSSSRSNNSNNSSFSPQSRPQPSPSSSSSSPKPKPTSSPHPTTSPTPDPVQSARDEVCDLTGICLLDAYYQGENYAVDQKEESLRCAQIRRTCLVASSWYIVLWTSSDLGIARW